MRFWIPLLGVALFALAAKGAAPPLYHGTPSPADATARETELLRLVLREFDGRAVAAPEACPALARAARGTAAILAQRAPNEARAARGEGSLGGPNLSAGEIVRALLEHEGVTDMTTFPFTLGPAPGEDPRHILRTIVERYILDRRVTHVGIGEATEGDSRGLIVLLFISRMVNLDPVPRAVAEGGKVEITGRVPLHFGFPRVLLTRPDGRVADATVYETGRGAFRSPLPLDAGAGRYLIEVLTSDEFGPQVAHLFPLFVGSEPPGVPDLLLVPPDPPDSTPESLALRVIELLARDRQRLGLPPLRPHAGLTRAAHAHSSDMAFRDYFGHRAPVSGPTPERVARFGVRARAVGETISIAPTTAKAHADLMRSPSHRRVLLDPEMTHVGVGVVAVGSGASRRLIITQKLAVLSPLAP